MIHVVGLTGGIGCGKSTIAKMFEKKGIGVIDADLVAHELGRINQPLYNEIKKYFDNKGIDVLNDDGSLNRKLLRELVFSNDIYYRWITITSTKHVCEGIKYTLDSIRALNEGTGINTYVILDCPLLFEVGWNATICDFNIVTYVTEETQIRRASERDNNSIEQIKRIMEKQYSTEEKIMLMCGEDTIIVNEGSVEMTQAQVDRTHALIMCIIGE